MPFALAISKSECSDGARLHRTVRLHPAIVKAPGGHLFDLQLLEAGDLVEAQQCPDQCEVLGVEGVVALDLLRGGLVPVDLLAKRCGLLDGRVELLGTFGIAGQQRGDSCVDLLPHLDEIAVGAVLATEFLYWPTLGEHGDFLLGVPRTTLWVVFFANVVPLRPREHLVGAAVDAATVALPDDDVVVAIDVPPPAPV